jgi:AcrR family transcriptional regulator
MARKLDEEKRTRILEAARDAFGSEGFQQTTIKHIAAATGIAQGTVYTYFGSKEELFDEVVNGIWEKFAEGLSEITLRGGSMTRKFTEFLDFGFELLVQVHPLLRGMYTEANRKELLREKVEAICQYIDELFVSADARPLLFDDLSDEARRFNLNMIVSGILFRTSLTTPERLVGEIEYLKTGVLKGLGERMANGVLS